MTTDAAIFIRKDVWIPPVDRFCEYEPSDESWCAPLSIGKFEERMYVAGFTDLELSRPTSHETIKVRGTIEIPMLYVKEQDS